MRALVREEVRRHFGSPVAELVNVRDAPMSANKLRRLIRNGERRGFKHGRDTFVRASELRGVVERQPAPVLKPAMPEPMFDPEQDGMDEMSIRFGVEPADLAEARAFHARLAARRAAGGERAAGLVEAERWRREFEEDQKRKEQRAATRAANKARRAGRRPAG